MGQIRVEEAASLEYYLTTPDHVLPVINEVQLGVPAPQGTYSEDMPPRLIETTKLIWDDPALPNGEAIWDGKEWNFNEDPVIDIGGNPSASE